MLGLKQKTRNPWDDIEARYQVGRRVHGAVTNVMPYGAFIQIEEGVEGLVHVSELSWTKRVAKASDVLAVGQEVDAVVLGVNRDEQKISLGIRQTESNPWDRVQEKYPIGTRISGKVRNFTNYGAFVEIEEGIDGMIHVSDMSWTRKVNHPTEVLKKGDVVDAVVLEVDPAQQRISLGLKQAQEIRGQRLRPSTRLASVSRARSANWPRSVRLSKSRKALTASCTSARSARSVSRRSRMCSSPVRKWKHA